MKQANKRHLLIILIPYILLLLIDLIFKYQAIDWIYFDVPVEKNVANLIAWGMTIVSAGLIFWLAQAVHAIFIKRQKDVQLRWPRLIVLLAVIINAYIFVLFGIDYYQFVLSALLLVFIYFIALKWIDHRYVQQSQTSTLTVNDALTQQFLAHFGDEANIINVSFTHSRLKVEVKDTKLVNLTGLKDAGATGVFIAGNKIQAFVGSDAEKLEKAIKRYLTQ